MTFAISPEVSKEITDLVMHHWVPGRFEECFNVYEGYKKGGAYGTVYKACCVTPPHGYPDLKTRDVAVKEIELRYASNYKTLTQHSRASKSLSRDSQLGHQFLAACQESVIQRDHDSTPTASNPLLHPNIARCYTSWIESPSGNRSQSLIDDLLDVINSQTTDISRLKNAMEATDGLKFYIVMDYYTYNLHELLQQAEKGKFVVTKANLIDVSIKILDALAHIHQLSYVHRDIKPQNILVNRGENGELTAAIGDFGLCRKMDDDLPKSGTNIYCNYPERYASQAADMWAFGVTLFQTFIRFYSIRKELPLNEMRQQIYLSHILEKVQTDTDSAIKKIIGKAIGGCNSYRRLKHVIHGCLHKDPQARYPAIEASCKLGSSSKVPATVLADFL